MVTFFSENSPEPLTLDSGWREFNRLFPTEEACVEQVRRILRERTRCSSCAKNIVRIVYGARVFKCPFCLKKRWLTAGTFFHRTRQVRPWLAAIFLFEKRVPFNAFQFHKLSGVAYSTAFSMLKKISVVAHNAMKDQDTVDVPSSLFLSLFTRRSLETRARKPPQDEQNAIDRSEGTNDDDDDNNANGNGTSEGFHQLTQQATNNEPVLQDPVESAIYQCLSLRPTTFDFICETVDTSIGELSAALTLMEIGGLIERLPYDRYVRSSQPAAVTAGIKHAFPHKKLVNVAIEYIRNKFGGISRKYLQNYISLYHCQTAAIKKGADSLLDRCVKFRSVSENEIRQYVSPPLVQMVLSEA